MANSEQKIEKTDSIEERPASIKEQTPVVEQKPEVNLETQIEKEPPIAQSEENIEPIKPTATPKIGASPQVRLNDYKKMSRKNQIKMLCQLAFEQGLEEAIKTAKDLDNAYVLDEFHDTLIDELFKRLVTENKLKKL